MSLNFYESWTHLAVPSCKFLMVNDYGLSGRVLDLGGPGRVDGLSARGGHRALDVLDDTGLELAPALRVQDEMSADFGEGLPVAFERVQ